MEYTVVVERGPKNLSAYVPDLPGCVAAADTLDELREMMRQAIAMHLELAHERGEHVPEPTSTSLKIVV